jgi:hypothetical protein
MRKWTLLAAVLTVATLVPQVRAQGGSSNEDLLSEIKAIKARLALVESENQSLKSVAAEQAGADLELQINSLTDRLVTGSTVRSAADPVTLTGEFRFRNTWSFGDNANGSEHDGSWTDSLVRLGFMYEFTRDVVAFAELQSHWAYGDEVATSAATGFFGGGTKDGFGGGFGGFDNGTSLNVQMHQAWLEVRNIFGRSELSNRTGRQEIVLGNQFQFGNADWYRGWSFDGTRWDWDSESFSLTALVLKLASGDGDFNQLSSFFTPHDDDELYSLYFTLKTIENHELDLYWIYVNGHGSATGSGSGNSGGSLGNAVGGPYGGTAYYHTVGGRIGGVFPDIAAGLDWNFEIAYQFGDANFTGGDADIDGLAVEAELGITFNKDSMFRIFARFLWAEGADSQDSGYVPLYPNRHSNAGFRARYGIFDLIPMTNVVTIQVGLHFDPANNWTLGATVLYAGTDEDFGSSIDDSYGWEIDVWGEYRYSEHLVFNGGLAFLFPDDSGVIVWGTDDDTQFLFYLQARLLF